MKTFSTLLTISLSALLGITAAAGYPFVRDFISDMSFGAPQIAVLNLNRIIEANEAEIISRGIEGEAILSEARRFSENLTREIESVQKDCNCTILVSSAVVSPHKLRDLTGEMLTRLSLTQQRTADNLRRLSDRLASQP